MQIFVKNYIYIRLCEIKIPNLKDSKHETFQICW